tara:strand:- start:208 stop:2166 length:1959 start_codon:yes stop_codon:yes gene_type:complete
MPENFMRVSTDKVDSKKEIRYLNRDFSSFKKSLIDFSKVYYPDTYNDFNETSPGMMFIEMASYVGDVLSFYIDKQFKESLLPYAEERENVIDLVKTLGYKPKATTPSTVKLDIYQTVPSKTTDGGVTYIPDMEYALQIDSGATCRAKSNSTNFRTLDIVDFKFSSSLDPTEITVYEYNGAIPSLYLLKKEVEAVAGTVESKEFTFGSAKKYNSRILPDNDISEILSCVDSDGNKWYEVPYLAQDTVFIDVANDMKNDPALAQYSLDTPYLLRLKKTARRFVSEITSDNLTKIQFGAGVSDSPDEVITPNPENVGSPLGTGVNRLDKAFDPANFLFTKSYGQVPHDTTLTITYARGGGIESNVPQGDITEIVSFQTLNDQASISNITLFNNAINSVAVSNTIPATGGKGAESVDELKFNALASFPSQNRAVTKEDYIIRCYSLPSKYGNIAKVYLAPDEQLNKKDEVVDSQGNVLMPPPDKIANPFSLNFYCLGYDKDKKLINLSEAVKENLRIYLSQYRMLTDAINILNGYIVNIGIDFEIITITGYNKREVVLKCMEEIMKFFDTDKWQINQPIIKPDLNYQLSLVEGVQNVTMLEISNITKDGYSNNLYDLKEAEPLTEEGKPTGIIYPSLDPMIFEIKYPHKDIKGRAR